MTHTRGDHIISSQPININDRLPLYNCILWDLGIETHFHLTVQEQQERKQRLAELAVKQRVLPPRVERALRSHPVSYD